MIPLFVFGASLFVYVLTLAPTISFFDSGEMISGSYTLGVAHPPGYPVYVTLGRLFTFLPLGSVAYRVNLMSAFFAAMTSVMVYYITRAMFDEDGEGRRLPGLNLKGFGIPEAAGVFAAMAFAFSSTLWAWAVVSKFYTLNAFVVSCILMLLIKWRRTTTAGTAGAGDIGVHPTTYLYAISFICGIALVVHLSQAPLFFVYGLYVFLVLFRWKRQAAHAEAGPARPAGQQGKRNKKAAASAPDEAAAPPGVVQRLVALASRVQVKAIVLAVFFFVLGHSIYLHVPIRALQEPLINWGGATDWVQFKWVWNREGYPTVGGIRSWGLFFDQLKSFDMIREFGWAGMALIIAGLFGHFKRDLRHFVVLVFGCVFMVITTIVIGNPPKENIFLLEQFYMPVYIMLAVLMGGAVYLVLKVRPSGPWILGLTLPFIFLGGVPTGYVARTLFGASSPAEKMSLMGAAYPTGLYFAFYAILAAVIALAAATLLKKRTAKGLWAYLAVFAALLVLYPASQVRAHYWKNDRSNNFIAYDMGNAELNFAPEFAVLFTWGDSGAFPMWYLQDVEHKREDVLLVHTPHLPLEWFLKTLVRTPEKLGDKTAMLKDYRYRRDYNGIKGTDRILRIPEKFRAPDYVVQDIVKYNLDRQMAFDYSSRYSIRMPYEVYPYGITYRAFEPDDYVDENLRTWRFLITRGLPKPRISLDLDDSKAVSIYGYIHADLGMKFLKMKNESLAERHFELALQYSPGQWRRLAPYMK